TSVSMRFFCYPLSHLHFFFFYCYADHRDLHSFPTRRSSDLLARSPSRSTAWPFPRACDRSTGRGHGCCSTRRFPRCRCGLRRTRSEEHTSELQSPYDLVCRLLLEKKKKKKTTKIKNKTNTEH